MAGDGGKVTFTLIIYNTKEGGKAYIVLDRLCVLP